jgi:transcriptional regulator with XRE-family HTH domain
VSPRSEIPEPWRTAMEKAGVYSFRALSEKTGIGTSTVTGLVFGDRRSSEQTMQAVADALRLEVTTIREWAAAALGESGPFELPAEANRLTRRERDAILGVVRAMLDPAGQEAGEETATGGQPADLLRLPLPDFNQVAARRDEQDDDDGT